MKNIIQKFKNWLIFKLGGVPRQVFIREYKDMASRHAGIIATWAKVVQEMCRRSEDKYYPFCCEYCATPCTKPLGWCKDFWPSTEKVQRGYTDR